MTSMVSTERIRKQPNLGEEEKRHDDKHYESKNSNIPFIQRKNFIKQDTSPRSGRGGGVIHIVRNQLVCVLVCLCDE
jgi:hypothetical protein